MTLEQGKYSKYLPFAFSEHGILQLRTMVLSNTEIKLEVEKIRKKVDSQDRNIEIIFRYFDELLEKQAEPRIKIGYEISKGKYK
ncbi:hypothetical protein [Pedobacter sp.]|uniref:hypothetical protein n=1 Tax=Pedobacter sp. TaxID=1411316 RepID=UPI003BAA3B3F